MTTNLERAKETETETKERLDRTTKEIRERDSQKTSNYPSPAHPNDFDRR
jgi:hypothetical protein